MRSSLAYATNITRYQSAADFDVADTSILHTQIKLLSIGVFSRDFEDISSQNAAVAGAGRRKVLKSRVNRRSAE